MPLIAYDVVRNTTDFSIVMRATPLAPLKPTVKIDKEALRLKFETGKLDLAPLPEPYVSMLRRRGTLLVIETGPDKHRPYLATLAADAVE